MSGREAGLWKWLRLRTSGLGHFSRVESETSPGIPDVHYQVPTLFDNSVRKKSSGQGWIELKADETQKEKFPFRPEDKGLRQSQIIWMGEYLETEGTNLMVCSALADLVTFHKMEYFWQVEEFNSKSRAVLIESANLVIPRRDAQHTQQHIAIRNLLT